MNKLIVIALMVVSVFAARLVGAALVASLLAGFSVAIFFLLFVAGWMAQDYLDAAGMHRRPSYP
ncbi:MAG: hypothetical protein AB7G68_07195 [Nitrospiraceae bacterium]